MSGVDVRDAEWLRWKVIEDIQDRPWRTRFGFCNDGLFCVNKFNKSKLPKDSFDCNISKDWLIDKWNQASKKHSSWVIVQLILIYHIAASVRATIWWFYGSYSPGSWCKLTSHTLLTPNSKTHTSTCFEYFWDYLFHSVKLPFRAAASPSGAEDPQTVLAWPFFQGLWPPLPIAAGYLTCTFGEFFPISRSLLRELQAVWQEELEPPQSAPRLE